MGCMVTPPALWTKLLENVNAIQLCYLQYRYYITDRFSLKYFTEAGVRCWLYMSYFSKKNAVETVCKELQ